MGGNIEEENRWLTIVYFTTSSIYLFMPSTISR